MAGVLRYYTQSQNSASAKKFEIKATAPANSIPKPIGIFGGGQLAEYSQNFWRGRYIFVDGILITPTQKSLLLVRAECMRCLWLQAET